MLVIALDTSTPAVTAGLVVCDEGGVRSLSEAVTVNPRAHGELLMPQLTDVLAGAGRGLREVDAIVVGRGPGPFTGLRVGMATAAALGHAHSVPVHPVCGLDAIAAEAVGTAAAGAPGALLVATDARRREAYWAAYAWDGTRLTGPHVNRPDDVPDRIDGLELRAASGELADRFGLEVLGPAYPTPTGLVSVARGLVSVARANAHVAGGEPEPLVPMYLRRPDATEPGPPKPVSTRGGA